ncbi:thioesterase II family protein [Kitasatospora sp. NPDC057500]|uniref:thioesterase II family protein n=1 Tax=Kitasatospora sp. NPDC057500 TaxID=3346151 RepID=UPI003694BABC
MTTDRTVDLEDRWLRRFHRAEQARVRLVCLPHAGGSASYFFPLSHRLAPEAEVLAVQYPGRQDRHTEPLFGDLGEAADRIAEALLLWNDLPVALFGHSMGATIGFEVARRLEAAGTVPVALFASGRRAPSRVRDEGIHRLADREFLAEMVSLGGASEVLLKDPEMLRLYLPVVRGDYRTAETYRYQEGPALTCPVVGLTGDRDKQAEIENVAAWAEHTTGPFELEVFPGGHFYLNDAPAVTDLVRDRLLALTG